MHTGKKERRINGLIGDETALLDPFFLYKECSEREPTGDVVKSLHGHHAGRLVCARGRRAEVESREHSGWPLHGLYRQQLIRISNDVSPPVMRLRPGRHKNAQNY